MYFLLDMRTVADNENKKTIKNLLVPVRSDAPSFAIDIDIRITDSVSGVVCQPPTKINLSIAGKSDDGEEEVQTFTFARLAKSD